MDADLASEMAQVYPRSNHDGSKYGYAGTGKSEFDVSSEVAGLRVFVIDLIIMGFLGKLLESLSYKRVSAS